MGRLKIGKVNLKLKRKTVVASRYDDDVDEPGTRHFLSINVQLHVGYFKILIPTNYFRKSIYILDNKCCFSDGQVSKSSQCQKK